MVTPNSLPKKVHYYTLTHEHLHTHTRIRFVSMMETAGLFLGFSFVLRIVSGVGIAMFSTASYTLLTQFFATKKGSVVVSAQRNLVMYPGSWWRPWYLLLAHAHNYPLLNTCLRNNGRGTHNTYR